MKNDNSFKEEQRFRYPVLLGALGIGALYYYGGLMNAMFKDQDPAKIAWHGPIVMSMLIALFVLAKLTTIIDEKGIYIRFFPFHTRFILYPWENITLAKTITYSPVKDFGGWGIRYGMNSTKAFNVKGNDGLYIELKSGEKRMIGTQHPEEIEILLATYLKQHPKEPDSTTEK